MDNGETGSYMRASLSSNLTTSCLSASQVLGPQTWAIIQEADFLKQPKAVVLSQTVQGGCLVLCFDAWVSSYLGNTP